MTGLSSCPCIVFLLLRPSSRSSTVLHWNELRQVSRIEEGIWRLKSLCCLTLCLFPLVEAGLPIPDLDMDVLSMFASPIQQLCESWNIEYHFHEISE